MALLERVSMLVRANLNDLLDKAEDPEKTIKQVILDMENQYLQVKTQVAVSIADLRVLERKLAENEENERQWMRRAETAVDKKDDALGRAAVERAMGYRAYAENLKQQVEDQKGQVENLKAALANLQKKLEEAQAKSDVLIAQHHRARALGKATEAGRAMDESNAAAFERMESKVQQNEAAAEVRSEMADDDVSRRFADLEKQQEIDRLLNELKSKRK